MTLELHHLMKTKPIIRTKREHKLTRMRRHEIRASLMIGDRSNVPVLVGVYKGLGMIEATHLVFGINRNVQSL